MYTRNPLTAGFAAVTLAFGLVACDEDRSPAGPTETAIPAAEAPQALIAPITAANLIAALNNVTVVIGELSALNNLTIGDVTVVEVENVRILNNSRFLNNVEILRNFLQGSTFLTNFLNDNNVLVSDVIAIDVLSGGDLIVFVE